MSAPAAVEYPLGGCRLALRRPFDLGFLAGMGRVFTVFGDNDSGNVSFGVERDGEKLFVKLAGASLLRAGVEPARAIENLRAAMPVYGALKHPALVPLHSHGPVPGGYIAVFGWMPGECLHAYWTYDRFPKYTHPQSAFYRFMQLPLAEKLRALEVIFEFHLQAAQRGYVAVDFYDGSVMYDFDTHTTTLCDIDFYLPTPAANTMGRMWGSSRFMAPEEFTLGAALDEVTNVYTMGAAAFVLLGKTEDRRRLRDNWAAGDALYAVAKRAVSDDRAARYPSLAAFTAAWRKARTADMPA